MQKAMSIASDEKLASHVQCPACRGYVAEMRYLARRHAREAARRGVPHTAATQRAPRAVTPLWDVDRG